MHYNDFEKLISRPRLHKYFITCDNNTRKAMVLYRANIRLSQTMFAVLSLFEVVLRNAIDSHYKNTLGTNWLFDAAQPQGFLQTKGCERSLESVKDIIATRGRTYNHDKAIAELSFGFWVSQFSPKHFSAAGSTLLRIFPAKPFGLNHTGVFKTLSSINKIRNRIAHHEPICFGIPPCISTTYASQKYHQLIDILQWMDIDTTALLYGIDRVPREIDHIDSIHYGNLATNLSGISLSTL